MHIVAVKREKFGTGISRCQRRAGQTPGILYGGKGQPCAITLDHNVLYRALKKKEFHSAIHDLEIAGEKHQVILRDFQFHAYKLLVLHVDFQRIDADSILHVKVPLHFINAEISPAVKLSSGIVSHVVNELDISCLPKDLPAFIEVDLAYLDVGNSIHVEDIRLPTGVTSMSQLHTTIVTATVLDDEKSNEGGAEIKAEEKK